MDAARRRGAVVTAALVAAAAARRHGGAHLLDRRARARVDRQREHHRSLRVEVAVGLRDHVDRRAVGVDRRDRGAGRDRAAGRARVERAGEREVVVVAALLAVLTRVVVAQRARRGRVAARKRGGHAIGGRHPHPGIRIWGRAHRRVDPRLWVGIPGRSIGASDPTRAVDDPGASGREQHEQKDVAHEAPGYCKWSPTVAVPRVHSRSRERYVRSLPVLPSGR